VAATGRSYTPAAALDRVSSERGRPYLALLSGDDQHEPANLVGALDLALARNLDYVQGSRWMRGGRVVGATGGRGAGTRFYSLIFSMLIYHRITDATNGFRVFRTTILDDPSIDIDQSWLSSYELEPYLLYRTGLTGRWVAAIRPVHYRGY
jgi:dolichol-phosphate mannosyltransferase